MYRTFGTISSVQSKKHASQGGFTMARLNTTNYNVDQQNTLDKTKQVFGAVLNYNKVLANSPKALKGMTSLWQDIYGGELDPKIRERVALAISEANSCEYCVSAHTAIGKDLGLNAQQILAARSGKSEEDKADRAVKFAKSVLVNQGELKDSEIELARNAGLSDAELVELIVLVGFFSIGNYIGKVSQIDFDFPRVEPLKEAACATSCQN